MINSVKDMIDTVTWFTDFEKEWKEVTKRLKESGYDLSKIKIILDKTYKR